MTDTLVSTGTDGWARTPWLLGPALGRQTLTVEVEGVTAEFSATATAPVPGTSYFGRNNYVEYIPGEFPLILSAPHGGSLRPEEIPDRSEGTVVQDANTDDLARRVAAALRDLTGKRPHLVITHLHRRKLDANREIGEAAQGNRFAERAWNEYHGWIEVARHMVERDHLGGFYVDLHGHGHEIQRLELGYLLSALELAHSDEVLSQPQYVAKSSIRALDQRSPLDFPSLLRGPNSLGALLTRAGYPAVPSHITPHPDGEPYFSGGYSTGRYGSRDGGVVDGVQIEANFRGVRDTPENREAFARALAESLLEFLQVHMETTLAEPLAESAWLSNAPRL